MENQQKNQKQQQKQYSNKKYITAQSLKGLHRQSFFLTAQSIARLNSLVTFSNKNKSELLHSFIEKASDEYLKITNQECDQLQDQQISEQILLTEQLTNNQEDYKNENTN